MNVSDKRGRRSQIVWKMIYLSIRKTQDSDEVSDELNVWDFSDTDVKETVISSDIPILQEINSSELRLWVELPILDNVRYDRDDVNPTEVHNVNELLRTSSTQFVVDDDEDEENEAEYEDEENEAEYEDEENEAEYEDEQEDVLVESDSD
ncbi:hypothetical protein L6452_27943 [Arctium lappa]|uniref:Uncharacterized protein n=1 Tax=Arctium lappa TaxID=4217 RepID=A0ACB8ZWX4_ARCLA|nr:hypothetical protein L6452_27943 [Arctium lappa]